jgi:hypothetical protein
MREVRAYARSLIGRKCKDRAGVRFPRPRASTGPGGITHDRERHDSKRILGEGRETKDENASPRRCPWCGSVVCRKATDNPFVRADKLLRKDGEE